MPEVKILSYQLVLKTPVRSSLVWLANKTDITVIITVDQADFSVYRTYKRKAYRRARRISTGGNGTKSSATSDVVCASTAQFDADKDLKKKETTKDQNKKNKTPNQARNSIHHFITQHNSSRHSN